MSELFIILGTPGSGRRELVAQLFDGLHGTTRVYFSKAEKADTGADAVLAGLEGFEVKRWFTDGEQLDLPGIQDEVERLVFITEGARNPIDQLEILSALAPKLGRKVARVITVVDCGLASREKGVWDWYKACIHFSDVVILNRREGVPPSFDRDFLEPYLKECVPTLFETTKKGRVANPDMIVLDESRRLSQAFDDDRDAALDMEFDEDNLPDEPFDLVNAKDKYFERDDRGARCIRIPDIKGFLK